ncbi:hypothetical protein N431DRAFT_348591 [Stipitochalara longipes BDJ]|nr:hypothetical protein N431DRAFT_348591 [Stipitochalara longipes BDJ]
MDAAWPSPMGVNPRDLELNHDVSYDHNISTSFQGPPAHSSNGTHYCYDSWPSEPAPTGSFMPIALAGPHLEIGAFDVGMPATGGDFHVNGTIGIPVDNDDIWYLQGRQEGYGGIGHSTPGVGPTSQQALPLFTCSSLEQTSNTTSQFSNKDRVAMTVPPPADSQDSQETSSTHPLNHIPSQPQRIRRIRRDSVKASRTRLSRSMTSPMLRSRRPLPPQKRVPPLSDLTQSKILKGARSLPSTQSSLECPIEKSASNNHTTVLREGIALVHETIKPFSLFSRRKATDLIKQVVRLVDQLDQLAAEEEKYGNASDDDESNEPSTATSSQDSLSNSELVDVDSETDNTSISSTSRQPIIESQESVTMNNGQHEPVHHPCLQCGNKSLYYCTRENCKYSTHSPAEWRRHEQSQKHSQRERFMCLECPQSPPGTDVNGDPVCEFCRTSIPELGIHLTAHYLQCQAAQRSCTTYGRKDRLIAHLRTQHRIVINTSPIAASGRFTIDCQWPRQCGFCRVTFMAWDERMDHIARHFEDGLDMSSWKLPLHPPEDLHPGFKPQPKDGSDSDDDMDDNDSPPSHYKPGIQNKSTFSSSSKTRNPTQQQRRSASHQGGRRHRQQVPLADLENEADSDATSNPEHICGILALEWIPNGTSAPGRKTTSVALDRYLKDVEEPFQAQVITQNSVLPKESSNQDTTIAPEGADQKKEFTGNQKHEASKSRDWQPSPTLQIPPRTQNRFDQILIPAKFSRYQPRSPTQGSTSSSSLQTLRASKPAADTPMKYTSRTDRSSRARKGVPVHTCDICLPVKVRSLSQSR